MSETPRTDRAVRECMELQNGAMFFECKALERDLNKAAETIKRLENALVQIVHEASQPLGAGQSLTLEKIQSIAMRAKEAKP